MPGGKVANLSGMKGEDAFEKVLKDAGWSLYSGKKGKFLSKDGKNFDEEKLPELDPLTYVKKQYYTHPSMRWEFGDFNNAEFVLSGGITVQVKNQKGSGSVTEKWAYNLLSIAAQKQPTDKLLYAAVGEFGTKNFDKFLRSDIKKAYLLFNDEVRQRLEGGAFICVYGWDETIEWVQNYTNEQTETRRAA